MSSETQEGVQQESSLKDFNWDDSGEWFGIKSETEDPILKDVPPDVKVAKKPAKEEDQPEKEMEEPSEEESIDFFGVDPSKEEGDQDDDFSSDAPDQDYYKEISKKLVERGLFEEEDFEGDELNDEVFAEKIEEGIQRGIDEFAESFAEALSSNPDTKALIKFLKNGGGISEFISSYAQVASLPVKADITTDEGKNQVARYAIKNVEGTDDDLIEGRIQWLKDRGLFDKYVEKHHEKFIKQEKEEKERLLTVQEQKLKEQKANLSRFKGMLSETLSSSESVRSIKVSPSDMKMLPSYISDPVVQVAPGKYIPQLNADLGEILRGEDPEDLLALAKLIQVRKQKGNFDFTFLGTSATTSKTKEARKKISDSRSRSVHSRTSKAMSTGKSLADRF